MLSVDKQKHPFAIHQLLSMHQNDRDETDTIYPSTYLRWLTDLRLQLITQYWPLDQHPSKWVKSVLTSTQIDAKCPRIRPSSPSGTLWIAELGRTHWTFKAEIHCDRTLIATATQTGFQVHRMSPHPILIPEELADPYWEFQWRFPMEISAIARSL